MQSRRVFFVAQLGLIFSVVLLGEIEPRWLKNGVEMKKFHQEKCDLDIDEVQFGGEVEEPTSEAKISLVSGMVWSCMIHQLSIVHLFIWLWWY